MNDVVLATVRDSIAQLTLNRPASYNALNIETARALTRALLDIGADPAVRGVIITGSGAAFSAAPTGSPARRNGHGHSRTGANG